MKRTISFTLRMPEDLHAQLDRAAQDSHHSMNALALDAIRSSLQPPAETTLVDDIRKVWAADFTGLEQRVLAHLHPESQITELHIGTAVVTGSIPETDPQKINDLINATFGLSEVPAISTTGRQHIEPSAASLGNFKQFSGRIKRLPLKGQTWVITGSLETMTRDRAREILMELGATVAGTVSTSTNGLIWGPGAGSKLTYAKKYRVPLWNERQFIHMIQGMGVDMPLPKTPAEQHLVTPGALEWDGPVGPGTGLEWTENTGVIPEAAKGKMVDLQRRSGGFARAKLADCFHWGICGTADDILQWRLSSIELQPQVQPRAPK